MDVHDAPDGTYFKGKRHAYGSPLVAQVWNAWRTLRIMANQIISREPCHRTEEAAEESAAASVIRRLSAEICVSTPEISASPRE